MCIIGGGLMLLSSLVGSLGFIGTLLTFIGGLMGAETAEFINLLLIVLGFIAGGGGLTVIIGALIAGFGPDRLGRFIIGLGIGVGLIGLIILIITNLMGGLPLNDLFAILLSTFNGIYGFIGVVLSIFSRMRMK
ncbi:MAG: hypothetical protein EU531_09585 [Promethearchaeota archaeon]|nr:MAG: hypothetical protein EU531_09585 [Candidatus Lokiarchaeota archaeon]